MLWFWVAIRVNRAHHLGSAACIWAMKCLASSDSSALRSTSGRCAALRRVQRPHHGRILLQGSKLQAELAPTWQTHWNQIENPAHRHVSEEIFNA